MSAGEMTFGAVDLRPKAPRDRPSRRITQPRSERRAEARMILRRRRQHIEAVEAPGTALSLREFIREVAPHFVFYRHTDEDIERLQAVADDELKRYLRFYPPRHGKSELGSRLFPAYYVAKHPDRWGLLTGHTASLVQGMSRNALDHYERSGRIVRRRRYDEWETFRGGGLRAYGVRGSITGKGFHLGMIDDPIKDALESSSDLILRRIRDWYDSTFLTRAEPGAAIMLTMTRWRYNDLAGHIIEQEREEPEGWAVMNYEAIRTSIAVDRDFPASMNVIEDTRKEGEALCRSRYTEEDLLKIERRLKGSGMGHFWTALYQQRPGAEEGNLWRRSWFPSWQIYDQLPPGVFSLGFDWDLAYTEDIESNSGSAYIYAGSDEAGNAYIEDLDFAWKEFPELIKWMKDLGGPHYIEAKGPGKSAKQTLRRSGVVALEVPVAALDKVARTRLASPPAEAGRIFVNRRVISRLLDDERQGILKFPNGPNTDLNDALVQMINRLLSWALPRYRSLSSKAEAEQNETI